MCPHVKTAPRSHSRFSRNLQAAVWPGLTAAPAATAPRSCRSLAAAHFEPSRASLLTSSTLLLADDRPTPAYGCSTPCFNPSPRRARTDDAGPANRPVSRRFVAVTVQRQPARPPPAPSRRRDHASPRLGCTTPENVAPTTVEAIRPCFRPANNACSAPLGRPV